MVDELYVKKTMKFTSKNLEKHIRFRQGYEFGVDAHKQLFHFTIEHFLSDRVFMVMTPSDTGQPSQLTRHARVR